MRGIPNFGEFYQRSLIPIGTTDRLSVQDKPFILTETDHRYTHWLIALEGRLMNNETGAFHWQVVVFPSKLSGGFDYKFPYFVSTFFHSMNEAIDYINKIEKMATADQLFTIAN